MSNSAGSDPAILVPEFWKKHPNELRERRELAGYLSCQEPGAFDPETATMLATDDQRRELVQRLEAGRSLAFSGRTRTGPEVVLVLGFDFGTSCSKLAVRAPYLPGPAVAVPALPFAQSDRHPFLWSSRLWLGPDGSLSLLPIPGWNSVDGIKAGLLSRDPNGYVLARCGEYSVTPVQAAVAYMALMTRQARGWIYRTHRDRFDRGPLAWSMNVGFPAAALGDRGLAELYGDIAAAAWRLAGVDTDGLTCGVFPEIAAAIMGFMRSPKRQDGLFVLVDVGATTLDVASFTLFADRQRLQDRISVWLADVERYGVRPWEFWRAAPQAGDFPHQAECLLHMLIWQTKMHKVPLSDVWGPDGVLRVLRTGGGVNTDLHARLLNGLQSWLRLSHLRTQVQVSDLGTFEGLDLGASRAADSSRLLVAAGLSYPAVEFPGIAWPHDLRDIVGWAAAPEGDRDADR